MRRPTAWSSASVLVFCLAGWHACTCGQEPQPQQAVSEGERFARLEKTLSGAKLSGSFTVTGKKAGELSAEEYHILECKKLPEGNLWMIQARIKYGQHDVTVPIPVPIEWAGATPVITLDDFEVPLMGTFDANVLFDLEKRQYAGTWAHGEVGGHLFGEILAGQAAGSSDSATPAQRK